MRKLPALMVGAIALTGAAVTPATATPQPQAAPAQAAASVASARLIVGYKPKSAERDSDTAAGKDIEAKVGQTGVSARLQRRLGTGAALVDLGGKRDAATIDKLAKAFQADPDVAYVAPDRWFRAMAAPVNDPEYGKQWDLFESTAGMNVPNAWTKSTGKGVTVAVIDTGYITHSDVAANIVSGYDFISDSGIANDGDGRDSDPADTGDWLRTGECGTDQFGNPVPPSDTNSSWHGTHVAGTIAAVANNNKGIAGIAYQATVQPVRVLGKCGGTTADIIDAITWASGGTVQGVPANRTPAKVINMSLGGDGACDQGTQSAINGAVSRGTTVVVAAGNESQDAGNTTPASCDSVITVAASNRQGSRAGYSNYGSVVDITAPGGETHRTSADGILSTLNTGTRAPGSETYRAYQGTSMATPHIAGLAALLYSANPGITPGKVSSAITSTARKLPGSCSGCGAGLADAAAALGASGGTDPEPTPTGKVFTNANDVSITDDGRWATSPITVSGRSGNGPANLKVSIDIKHPYRGDLAVQLLAPNGSYWPLVESNYYDNQGNLVTSFELDASTVAANGTWKLQAADVYSGYTGYIDSWSLTF